MSRGGGQPTTQVNGLLAVGDCPGDGSGSATQSILPRDSGPIGPKGKKQYANSWHSRLANGIVGQVLLEIERPVAVSLDSNISNAVVSERGLTVVFSNLVEDEFAEVPFRRINMNLEVPVATV